MRNNNVDSDRDNVQKPGCIVVSGLGHTGSRLVVDLLATHPDIGVPIEDLNDARELGLLHAFFISCVDNTPIHSKTYAINKEELFFFLDSYLKKTTDRRKYTVLKFPHYLLWCLDYLHEYFEGNIKLIYTCRDANKIKASHVRRGEDVSLFSHVPHETLRQIKKLDPQRRRKYMTGINLDLFLNDLAVSTYEWKEHWESTWADMPTAEFDADVIAKTPIAWGDILEEIGLSIDGLSEAIKLIDQKRLQKTSHAPLSSTMLGSYVKKIIRTYRRLS